VVREIRFIVTLVTHSSGLSSSGLSRGIHHRYKHPLNPTKLYVFGWVESSRSVLIESHNMFGWCLDYWMVRNIFDCMIKMLLALAYPVYCMVVLYVVLLSCDDHQFDWWEQMGEVPEVSKEMEIPQHSPRGLVYIFCMSSSRAATHKIDGFRFIYF